MPSSKTILFLAVLAFGACCCSPKPSSGGSDMIQVDLTKPQNVSLFDYFKHIELIPLETNDNVVIGDMEKVIYHQNRYYVLDGHRDQNIVLVFDDVGKFLFKIGNRGNGPGEYLLLYDIAINPFTGNIELLDAMRKRIFSYDLQGNYVKSTDQINHDELYSIRNIAVINEKTYVLIHGAAPFKIIYYDLDEQRIFHYEYEENLLANRLSNFYHFYEYNGQSYFYHSTDRVTYKIEPDSLVKAYSWDFGKFNYDVNEIDFPEIYRNDSDKRREYSDRLPYRFLTQGQNNRFIISQIYQNNHKPAILIFDKSTQECKLIEHFTEPVYFKPLIVTDEYVMNFIDPGKLEEAFPTTEMLDESNRQKIEVLIRAGEEQNPVIIKYKFK